MNQNKNFLSSIAQQYIRAQKTSYSQSSLNFLMNDPRYLIEDLGSIKNRHEQKIKCTLIKHRITFSDRLQQSLVNSVCLIYLHGLRGNRIESLQLLQYLPKQICLCTFDFSGSGKSQGNFVTYGLKQQQDIETLIQFLFNKKFIREFVIWGRSMGAVAALLYVNNLRKQFKKRMLSFTLTEEKNNDLLNANIKVKPVIKFEEGPVIRYIVLDSPFQNFRDLARLIGSKTLNMPEFMLNIGLDYVEQAISHILLSHYTENYNPFLIRFDSKIKVDIPILMICSRSDQLIPFSHFEKLVSKIESKCQVFQIKCSHNEKRPPHTIREIIAKIFRNKTDIQLMQKNNVINKCEKKRGIKVVCSSRQSSHIKSKQSLLSQKQQAKFIYKMSEIHTQVDGNFLERKSEIHSGRGLLSLHSIQKRQKQKAKNQQMLGREFQECNRLLIKKTLKKENEINFSSKRIKYSFKNESKRNKTDHQI